MNKMQSVRLEINKTRKVATIWLNRPHVLNAIDDRMADEVARAVGIADENDNVRVIVIRGSGKGFCSGYDLKIWAERKGSNAGQQDFTRPWDPIKDYRMMKRNTNSFMSLQKTLKPTIALVHGVAVAGGSDIALCADLVLVTKDARLGYMPARVWGIPTTIQWVSRVGFEKAKGLLFTGDIISGTEAARIGLVYESCDTYIALEKRVDDLVDRISAVPANQLAMVKLLIQQQQERAGLNEAQTLATLFDGIARHSPEGVAFKRRAEQFGFRQAVRERDTGSVDWTALANFEGGLSSNPSTTITPPSRL